MFDILLKYCMCGIVFGLLFELLMKGTNYKKPTDTSNWSRLYWVTCWPYCMVKFFQGYYGNSDKDN